MNDSNVEYPIFGVIGDRGTGKTITITALALVYQSLGFKVFSNYELKGIPHEKISFMDLVEFPEYLHDGVVLLDEAHIGADSYQIFSKRVQSITKFVTQTRKRRLVILYTTQIFTQVAKRLRLMTNYILECHKLDNEDAILVKVFERTGIYIKEFIIDASRIYGLYDTNEIIELEE